MDSEQIKSKFESKYAIYGDMLYKIAVLYMKNPDDAEDVLQEVFIKLFYSAPIFKDLNHEKAWLIRVTQNTCRDFLKSSEKKNVSLDFDLSSYPAQDGDIRLDVLKQLFALPEKYKTAVILFYYYDYSVGEISQTLKISKSAVKMRLKRGREILKIELEEYENEK